MSFAVRTATTSDIAPIARILVDTWRITFRDVLPDAFLDAMSETKQEERYGRLLARSDCVCFVAVDHNDGVLGFVSGGPTRSSLLGMPNEVYALYVRQSERRSGIGKALFDRVSMTLSESSGGLCVWVLEINPCRLFYQHLGAIEAAREEILLGADHVVQIGYTWPT